MVHCLCYYATGAICGTSAKKRTKVVHVHAQGAASDSACLLCKLNFDVFCSPKEQRLHVYKNVNMNIQKN